MRRIVVRLAIFEKGFRYNILLYSTYKPASSIAFLSAVYAFRWYLVLRKGSQSQMSRNVFSAIP
jgi:hypothetical protein